MKPASLINYIKSAIEEAKKAVWPTREIVVQHTIMVVSTVSVAVVVFAGVDYVFQKLVVAALNR